MTLSILHAARFDTATWARSVQLPLAAVQTIAAVAGKVMTVATADEDTVKAAWLYRVCEYDTDQPKCLQTIADLFGAKTSSIVRSMVCPIGATQAQLNERFTTSLPPAKLIRTCECVVALNEIAAYLFGGCLLKLEDAKIILEYSTHVYKNSDGVDNAVRAEMLKLLKTVQTLYIGIRSTAEGVENVLGPAPHCGVTLLVVTNDLGTVTVRPSAESHPEPANLRQQYDAMRTEVQGTIFAESLFHITVPLPKVSTATLISLPAEQS